MDSKDVVYTIAPEGVEKVALNAASGLTVRKLRDALALVLPENLDRPLDLALAINTGGEGADSRFHVLDTLSIQSWDTGHMVFFMQNVEGRSIDASRSLRILCTVDALDPWLHRVFDYTVRAGQGTGHADSEG